MTEEKISNGAKKSIELCGGERYVEELSLSCMAVTWSVHMKSFCMVHFRLDLRLLEFFKNDIFEAPLSSPQNSHLSF